MGNKWARISDQDAHLYKFDEEPWEVALSDSAYDNARRLRKALREKAVEVLKVLASGRWPPALKAEVGAAPPLKVRRASFDRHSILWSIDVDFSIQRDLYVEVLQVWDLVKEEEEGQVVGGIIEEWQLSQRSFKPLYKAFHRMRVVPGGDIRLPRTLERTSLGDIDAVAARKFFTLNAEMLHALTSDEADQGGLSASEQFPLRISRSEAEVTAKPGPVICIGRSGSGKTLCCAYRIFLQHTEYWDTVEDTGGAPLLDHGNDFTHLHQLFVTHSASLARKVSEYFDNLRRAREVATSQFRPAITQPRLPDDMRRLHAFPAFSTYRKFLVMVDGSTMEPFFPRTRTGAVDNDRVDFAAPPDALDPLENLRQQHLAVQRAKHLRSARQNFLTEVDDSLFVKEFWPKIRQRCPKINDPLRLWRKIQSDIKGSLGVLNSGATGYLSLEDADRSIRRSSEGLAPYADQIYGAFLGYQELLGKWNCFDRMDACFNVIRRLAAEGYRGPPIHTVIVDEVQDLSQLELALFFRVMATGCKDIFCTGDTTQTVSKAVDFRFCDLRSVFYHFGGELPQIDQLVVNYRSHTRILRLSHFGVVRLLEVAFPQSLDKLQPDTGHRDGPSPIVQIGDVQGLLKTISIHGKQATNVVFGSSQCILVRSDAARSRLPPACQNALVLTIEQSKGLEFDDVVIANFFTSSDYQDWQVVKVLKELLRRDADDTHEVQCRVPDVGGYRHELLCSELKHLYTAITRTKHQLIFVEEEGDKAMHMVDLWRELGLVDNSGNNTALLQGVAQRAKQASSNNAWLKQGRILFQKRLFDQAKNCFTQAGDKHMQDICDAHKLAQSATEMLPDDETKAHAMFTTAATMFASLQAPREHALCLAGANQHLQAALVFQKLGPDFQVEAAKSFSLAGCFRAAAVIYRQIGDYQNALSNFVNADEVQEVISLAEGEFERGHLTAGDCYEHLRNVDAHDIAGKLYKKERNYAQAANCYRSKGMHREEAHCRALLEDRKGQADALREARDVVSLREAAIIYQDLGQKKLVLKCSKDLLTSGVPEDEERVLKQRVARLNDELGNWSMAAKQWSDLGGRDALAKAGEAFQKAGLLEEAGEVWERRASLHSPSEPEELAQDLERAAEMYRRAEHFDKAAKLFCRVGRQDKHALCLKQARLFWEALSLIREFNLQDPELEIECLVGAGSCIQAAGLQMELAKREEPANAQMVLKALILAKKASEEDYRSFFHEFLQFQAEMPHTSLTEMVTKHFAGLGASGVQELAQHLVSLGKHGLALAVHALSGDFCALADSLFEADGVAAKDVIELVHSVVMSGASMEADTIARLTEACEKLVSRGDGQDSRSVVLFNAVQFALWQRCGASSPKSVEDAVWLDTVGLCALEVDEEALLTLTAGAIVTVVKHLLHLVNGTFYLADRAHGFQHRTRQFRLCTKLHEELLSFVTGDSESAGMLVPAYHVLAKSGKPNPALPFMVLMPDRAVREDLLNRARKLLKLLVEMQDDEGALAAPDLCKAAECSEKDVMLVTLTAYEVGVRLGKPVPPRWDSLEFWRKLWPFVKYSVKDLRAVVTSMVNVCTAQAIKKGIHAVQHIESVVLEPLTYLKPVCPWLVAGVSPECKCPLDHPEVAVKTDPKILLNVEEKAQAAPPPLAGIGLQAYLDVLSVCKDSSFGECSWGCRCRYRHLEQDLETAVQWRVQQRWWSRRNERSSKHVVNNIIADELRTAHGTASRPLPDGFGYVFFDDPDKAELKINAMTVTILAEALVEKFEFVHCHKILLRMCHAVYRYPHPDVTCRVPKLLRKVNDDDLSALSKGFTGEMYGSPASADEDLLRKAAGLKPRTQARPQAHPPQPAVPR